MTVDEKLFILAQCIKNLASLADGGVDAFADARLAHVYEEAKLTQESNAVP